MYSIFVIIGISLACCGLLVFPWMFHEYNVVGGCDQLTLPIFIPGVLTAVSVLVLAGLAIWYRQRLFQSLESRKFRFTFYFGTVFILVLLSVFVAAGNILLLLSQTKPHYGQDYTNITGIDGDIEIARDRKGAPTITAHTLRDALFGQGLVHAQDRISQLVLERAASRGQISQIVGRSGLAHDTMALTYNFNATASAMWSGLSPFHRSLMRSYTEGINTYLRHNPVLPPDMYLYSKNFLIPEKVEPWTVHDLCRSMVQYQTQLSSNCDAEIKRWTTFWDTKDKHRYETVEHLFPGQRHFRDDESLPFTTILSEDDLGSPHGPANVGMSAKERNDTEDESFRVEKRVYEKMSKGRKPWRRCHCTSAGYRPESPKEAIQSTVSESFLHQIVENFTSLHTKPDDFVLFEEGGLRGSNAWVVSSPESTTTIVANDPHLDMYLPGPWHFSTLRIRSTNEWYSGATHVGLPGMSVGSSNYLSWGLTLALTDICDLFVIQRDRHRPQTHYRHKSNSLPFTFRKESISVRGGDTRQITIRETIYGPMLDNFKDSKVHCLAVWNAASQKAHASKSLESFLNFVTGIRTVTELRDNVLHGIAAPALSIVMADHTGGIGYGVTGLHPHRRQGHTGRYPIPGTGEYDHHGMIPMIELPWKIVPHVPGKKNFIAAGNNKIYPDAYKYRLGYEYSSNHRAVRIAELLEGKEIVSTDSMKKLQLDAVSNIWVRNFRPWLLRNGSIRQKIPALDAMFHEWDGDITREDRHAPILWEYMQRVITKYRTRFGIEASRHVDPIVAYYITTDECNTNIVEESWKEAFEATLGLWGSDWGFVQIPHFSLANSIFKCLGNRYPSKTGGDFTSVNMIGGRKSTKSNWRHFGPSLRLVMETTRRTQYAIPGGFSENPFSRYYDNLMDDWAKGLYEQVDLRGGAKSKHITQRILKSEEFEELETNVKN